MNFTLPKLTFLVRFLVLAGVLAGILSLIGQPGAVSFNFDRVLDAVQQKYGSRGVAVAKDWYSAMQLFSSGSDKQKMNEVNEFLNRRIRFEDDNKVWGTSDYWATPMEALNKGAGDCEDFSIAKYFSLKTIGVPVSKLRMTYVKAKIGGPNSNITQAHMVLAYYSTPDAEPLIMDNLVSEIRPASRRPDLTPIFSFNTEGLWVTGGGGEQSQPGGGSRLSKWTDMLAKMQSEGFD